MSLEALLDIRKQVVSRDFLKLTIEPAYREDVPELVELFARFFEESGYGDRGIVFSRAKSATWLDRVIEFGTTPHIVARMSGKIIGVVSYDLDDSFCVKPVAILHTVYVVPEHRRSTIGRMLIGLATDSAISVDGACAFHAPIASGIEEGSLKNLFIKAGFQQIGVIMGRKL
jgi:L-amino acid N-acyltransferase YncA